MEPEIRLRDGSYVILYAEKVAILPKNPCTFYIARLRNANSGIS